MKKRISSITAALLCLTLLFAGCATPVAADLMANVQAAEKPAAPDLPAKPFRDAAAEFSWNLLRESAANPGNILISPASVYLALAMTLNGAATTTRAAMLTALAADGLTVDVLNIACRDWQTLLAKSGANAKLTLANSIWYRQGFSADKTFLQKNADFYAAGARILDFNKPEAVETINDWVSKSTHGIIDKILEKIGPAAVMYLINTLYFKADWKTPFIKNYTAESTFSAPAGQIKVPMMHRSGGMAYLEQNGVTGVLLPYADEKFAFIALLPQAGQTPRQLIGAASPGMLSELLQSVRTVSVDLALPLFESSYDDSLINEMKNLGMGPAFQSGAADFSLMNAERSKDLFISEIKHKTFIKINEIGTEAAAATLVEISKSSLPVSEIKLAFDRPFIYGIIDLATGIPIFIGILENPVK